MPTLTTTRSAALLLLAAALPAQTLAFTTLPTFAGATAAVHDPLRLRTWFAAAGSPARCFEWDGQALRERSGDLVGVTRVLAMASEVATGDLVALAFDLQQQLLAGRHDGRRWQWQAAPALPHSNPTPVFTYDAARGRFVAYGFFTNSTSVVQEFDGTTWSTHLLPQLAWRNGPAFAYDPLGQRCVLFGGTDLTGPRGDGWTWDGTTAAPLSTTPGPGPRLGASFAFAASQAGLVLYGDTLQTTPQETWVLRGSTWTRLATTSDAGPKVTPVLVEDGQGLIACGRDNSGSASGHRLLGTTWSPLPGMVAPQFRQRAAVGFDRQRNELVVFGGTSDDFDLVQVFAAGWQQRQPATTPGRRTGAKCAWSAADGQLLFFGGSDATGVARNDTWLWNGSTFVPRPSPAGPAPRLAAALAPAPGGGVLLYGGFLGTTLFADHWHWDGTGWQLLASQGAPGPVTNGLAAFDEGRGETLLFDSLGSQARTWRWDGGSWTLAATDPAPPFGAARQLAYSPQLGRVVAVIGGAVTAWNGTAWQPLASQGDVPSLQALVTDPGRGVLLGLGAASPLAVTLVGEQLAATAPVGTACATQRAPELVPLQRPALGSRDFALDLGTAAAGAPCLFWCGLGGTAAFGPCTLWTGPTLAAVFATTHAGGNATLAIPLPADPQLLGQRLVVQGAVYDPPRSPLGNVGLSAGLELRLGW